MAFAVPMMLLATSGNTFALTLGMVLGLHVGCSACSRCSVTLAEMSGARTRFTQLAPAKEIGGIFATARGPSSRRP
ncbi:MULTISPECIES: hypothetical protein [unclassified Streptomyces]|uniref:hypothetical protein n=1 Tax=unclassified Streptomyces TaxID=2593676 RepID=UPI003805D044